MIMITFLQLIASSFLFLDTIISKKQSVFQIVIFFLLLFLLIYFLLLSYIKNTFCKTFYLLVLVYFFHNDISLMRYKGIKSYN